MTSSLLARITKTELRLILTVGIVLAAFARPKSIETNRALELAESMALGSLTIDAILVEKKVIPPARDGGRYDLPSADDPQFRGVFHRDRSYRDGHFYAGVAPGLSVGLAVPAGAARLLVGRLAPRLWAVEAIRQGILNLFGVLMFIIPTSILSVLLVHRINARFCEDERSRLFLTLVYAFGTWNFYYGTNLNAWQPTNACLLFALYAGVVRERMPTSLLLGCAGVALAFSVALNYFVAALLPVVALGIVWRHGVKSAVPLAAGVVMGALPLLAYHWHVCGSPFSTPYAHRVDAQVATIMGSGVQGFSYPSPVIALRLLADPRWGILPTVPVALLAFAAYRSRRSGYAVLGFAGFAMIWLMISGRHSDFHSGEGGFGSRYLVPSLPFVWLLVLEARRHVRGRVAEGICVLSLGISTTAAMFAPNHVYTTVSQFLLRGIDLPLLRWCGDMLTLHTTRRPPIDALGIAITVAVVLFFVWRDKPLNLLGAPGA